MDSGYRNSARMSEVKGSPRNHHDDSMTNLMAENTLRVSDADTTKMKMRKMQTKNQMNRMSTKISGTNLNQIQGSDPG